MTDEKRPQPADSQRLPPPPERDATVIRFKKEPLLTARADTGACLPGEGHPASGDPYQQLLDTIYDAVLVSTVTGNITDANLRSVDFLLYSLEELRRMRVTNIIAGADANLLPTIMASLDRDRYALLEAKCIRRDGSRFACEIAVSRICCDGQTKLFLFIRDLTVRKQAEKALRETLSRLEKQDRARALLVSNVTHELRTPLTSLMYGLSNLLSGATGPVTPQVRQYLERFNRECQRLLSTVEDILYLERIETRTLRLSRITTSANRLVARSATALELHARHKGITLSRSTEGDPVFAHCDPAKMERVLMNIVGNAIKYTPDGGSVTITAAKHPAQDQALLINVTDTGVGIPSHAINNVMDRYYRVGEHADGAGLGLAIAKDITELHGGTIQITSPPPGKSTGTLVSISIPSADPPTLLLLGDEASTTHAVMEQLTSSGYRISAETSVARAMERLRNERIDLLIVDFPLKDAGGTEAIAAIRGNELDRRIPIVVVSAGDLSAAQKEIFSCLSIPVLKKAWKPDELLGAIDQAFLAASSKPIRNTT